MTTTITFGSITIEEHRETHESFPSEFVITDQEDDRIVCWGPTRDDVLDVLRAIYTGTTSTYRFKLWSAS